MFIGSLSGWSCPAKLDVWKGLYIESLQKKTAQMDLCFLLVPSSHTHTQHQTFAYSFAPLPLAACTILHLLPKAQQQRELNI